MKPLFRKIFQGGRPGHRNNDFLTITLVQILLFSALPLAAQPVISEFMADNDTVLVDEDGDFEDWIEIHNPGPGSLNLDGYHLTDDLDDLEKWQLPGQGIAEGGYLVVFASGKDRSTAGAQLHTNFKLDADGESLALVAPDGVTVVSSFGDRYPDQYPDVSYGFQTQGTNPTLRAGQPGYLIFHTPGAANTVIPGPHPLYCDMSMAQVEITASQSVWDELQGGSPDYPEGSVTFRYQHGDIDVTVTNVGIRGRGNTGLTKNPRSFRISFDSFVPGQDLFGMEKLNLNAEANDPSTARSKLCFDIAEAAGLPTEYANHVATVIIGPDNHRSGPDGVFFDAVLNNTQPVDDVFVKQRFANTRGNLYKCTYADGPANLTYLGPTGSSYSNRSRYDLKYQGSTDGSYDDLAGFIDIVNNTPTADFPTVIREHFEVDDFLKRLAIDVLTANWDGHWGNWNNFYLYHDPGSGKWSYIPFDFDNTLSIRWLGGDWTTQNMYSWGKSSDTPLVTRILGVTEFRNRYSYYMNQLVQGVYQNSRLNPLVYRIRDNQTAALPFGGLGVSNCKDTERDRYDGDWPNWTYSQYINSYDAGQKPVNGNVPNYYGITEFIASRRANTLNQLNLVNIGPIVSALQVSPALPATNENVVFTVRVEDDVQVATVNLDYSFNGGANSAVAMVDDGTGADVESGDGIYTVQLGPFGLAGTLSYYVTAEDNQSKSTFEPWGGSSDAATLEVGSPYLGLAITEINYNPHEPTGSELGVSTNADDYEFVELQNIVSSALSLADVQFIAGISYTFPSETLAPGERVVIVKNSAAFVARYGSGLNVSGEYGGQLSNGGEELHLISPDGDTIHDFFYQDTPPWPTRADDGKGSSLESINPAGDYSAPLNWRASIDYGGSPDAAGTDLPAGIVINEVLTHTDPPLVDAIELHNPTEAAINIGGWYLSDTDEPYRKYRIPSGTVLAADAYITFNETNHFNTSTESNSTDFALDSAYGDDVWLLKGDAQSNLVAFVDYVEFGAAINGESFGRWPNGTGEMSPMLERTLGGPNTGPRVGPVTVSEFMYLPASGDLDLEFVELYNGGSQQENLSNWQIAGDVDYAFPENTLLSPGEVLAILPFDPDLPANAGLLSTFRTHYGMGTAEPLVGPFLGSLSDSGGTIRLLRPDSPPAEEPTFTPLLLEDEVAFDITTPWPVEAAGGGVSLMRSGPNAWGNDPQSWIVAPILHATPGAAPMADVDGDNLPDSYEIETYGGTNVVGSSITGDTDGDGADDEAEYVAGTSSTNANRRFELSVSPVLSGGVEVAFETQPVMGPGYFGLVRRYDLEEAYQLGGTGEWSIVSGYSNLPAAGTVVTYTNSTTNLIWYARGRVSLQNQ